MITVFVILLFYQGEVVVLERNLPTHSICEKRLASIKSRVAEFDPDFSGSFKCAQTKTLKSEKGKDNVNIYHQASTAN